jgi:hypothetical protein
VVRAELVEGTHLLLFFMNVEDIDDYFVTISNYWAKTQVVILNWWSSANFPQIAGLELIFERLDIILFLGTFLGLWFVIGSKVRPSNSVNIFLTSLFLGLLGFLKVFIFYYGFGLNLVDCLLGFVGMGIQDDDMNLQRFLELLNNLDHGRMYYLLYLGVIVLRMISFVIFNRQVFSVLYAFESKANCNYQLTLVNTSALRVIQKAFNVAPLLYATCELYKSGCMISILFLSSRQVSISAAFYWRIYVVYLLKTTLITLFVALYFFGYLLALERKEMVTTKDRAGKTYASSVNALLDTPRRSSRIQRKNKVD